MIFVMIVIPLFFYIKNGFQIDKIIASLLLVSTVKFIAFNYFYKDIQKTKIENGNIELLILVLSIVAYTFLH